MLTAADRKAITMFYIDMADYCLECMQDVSPLRDSYWEYLGTGFRCVSKAYDEMLEYSRLINKDDSSIEEIDECLDFHKKFDICIDVTKRRLDIHHKHYELFM